MSGHNNTLVTMDAARAALSFISANDRGTWWRIAMALKSEFGDGGWELFATWSERASTFDAKAAKSTWKSCKPAGGVTIATLIWEARAGGFNPKDFAPDVPLSAADMTRIKQERTERDIAAAAELASKQAAAANVATQAWAAAADLGTSSYLVRKAISGHGVRYATGGALLVPLVDSLGKLWNVQRVFANGDKRFLKDGRVSGCFHIIGDIATSAWLLIAEGYATAATLHKTTRYAVAVAFNDSNLKHVAAAMRQLHPVTRLLICADDDSETAARTGRNPGIVAAAAAAKAVSGVWCKPTGLAAGKSDFNDLAAVSGPDEVQGQIAAAVKVADVVQPGAAPATKTEAIKEETGENRNQGRGIKTAAADD